MPKIECNMVECRSNKDGECWATEIEIDYAGTCITYEEQRGLDADKG